MRSLINLELLDLRSNQIVNLSDLDELIQVGIDYYSHRLVDLSLYLFQA